jgi:CheY-like chemotaxis protein
MYTEVPIVIVEDNMNDRNTLAKALLEAEVPNRVVFFENGPDAMAYLKTAEVHPFMILCDVNLPRQDGIEFKAELDNDPEMRLKNIPFIFYTGLLSQYALNKAYNKLTVQGFFQKNNPYRELKDVIRIIVDYWKICMQPETAAPSLHTA